MPSVRAVVYRERPAELEEAIPQRVCRARFRADGARSAGKVSPSSRLVRTGCTSNRPKGRRCRRRRRTRVRKGLVDQAKSELGDGRLRRAGQGSRVEGPGSRQARRDARPAHDRGRRAGPAGGTGAAPERLAVDAGRRGSASRSRTSRRWRRNRSSGSAAISSGRAATSCCATPRISRVAAVDGCGIGLVAGLAASRFLKASSERRYGSGDPAGSARQVLLLDVDPHRRAARISPPRARGVVAGG